MINEIIRPIVKVGNSSGVVLPKNWYGGKAKIELVEKPLNIKKDLLEILEGYLAKVLGVYLSGSYARGEEKESSDVDVLVITSDLNKVIKKGKYYIILISKKILENTLKKNVLPLRPMVKEAKTILNESLIREYKGTLLTKRNLKFHLETTKSALEINKSLVLLDKEKNLNSSDGVSYSLVLRLRGVYIVDCLIKNKMWSTKELKNLIKKVSGSSEAYSGYLRVKNDEKNQENLKTEEAEKIINYVSKKINEQEKWLRKIK